MRHVTFAGVVLLALGCNRPPATEQRDTTSAGAASATNTPLNDSQRKAMEDSASAFIARALQLARRPDSASIAALYPASGDILVVLNGAAITSRDELGRMISEETHQPGMQITFDSRKVDVLAPDAAAITTTFTVVGTDPKTRKKQTVKGAWTSVIALRDGAMRIIQSHQSNHVQ